jgi:hypothetical protein
MKELLYKEKLMALFLHDSKLSLNSSTLYGTCSMVAYLQRYMVRIRVSIFSNMIAYFDVYQRYMVHVAWSHSLACIMVSSECCPPLMGV